VIIASNSRGLAEARHLAYSRVAISDDQPSSRLLYLATTNCLMAPRAKTGAFQL
jgi:hypothetical protein